MKALVLGLMIWIHAQTGMPLPDEPPDVIIASRQDVCLLAGGGRNVCQGGIMVAGVYEGGVIFLNRDEPFDTYVGVSFVVHELVHYMQDPTTFNCKQEAEKQAYDTQEKFLRQVGYRSLEQATGLSEIFRRQITSCPWE